jgi:hypothetical protein
VPFRARDYLADGFAMFGSGKEGLELRGVHQYLVAHAINEGGSVPSDVRELAVRLQIQPAHVKRLLKRLWPLWHDDGNGRLVNDVLTDDYAEASRVMKAKREGGKLGASIRYGHGIPNGSPNGTPINSSDGIPTAKERGEGELEVHDHNTTLNPLVDKQNPLQARGGGRTRGVVATTPPKSGRASSREKVPNASKAPGLTPIGVTLAQVLLRESRRAGRLRQGERLNIAFVEQLLQLRREALGHAGRILEAAAS